MKAIEPKTAVLINITQLNGSDAELNDPQLTQISLSNQLPAQQTKSNTQSQSIPATFSSSKSNLINEPIVQHSHQSHSHAESFDKENLEEVKANQN